MIRIKHKHLHPSPLVARLLLTCMFGVPAAMGQGAHSHQGTDRDLGQVNFPITCSKQSQAPFNRAVAWLHSFEYEEAEKAFAEIVSADPKCGMAFWGVAMSNYHPIWAQPSSAELRKGRRH